MKPCLLMDQCTSADKAITSSAARYQTNHSAFSRPSLLHWDYKLGRTGIISTPCAQGKTLTTLHDSAISALLICPQPPLETVSQPAEEFCGRINARKPIKPAAKRRQRS